MNLVKNIWNNNTSLSSLVEIVLILAFQWLVICLPSCRLLVSPIIILHFGGNCCYSGWNWCAFKGLYCARDWGQAEMWGAWWKQSPALPGKFRQILEKKGRYMYIWALDDIITRDKRGGTWNRKGCQPLIACKGCRSGEAWRRSLSWLLWSQRGWEQRDNTPVLFYSRT